MVTRLVDFVSLYTIKSPYMPKLVVTVEDKLLSEWPLDDRDVLIGRGPDCHVVVRDPLVSRHHAKISRAYGGYFVEDLESTNGVTVNGRRVRKQMLKYGDNVKIGTHDLCLTPEDAQDNAEEYGVTVCVRPSHSSATPSATPSTPAASPPAPAAASLTGAEVPQPPTLIQERERGTDKGRAHVRYLTGTNSGTSDALEKSLYSIGEPGGNLAVISRRGRVYVLQHLGGARVTTLNGEPVASGAGVRLSSGDRIQVGETQLEFSIE